MNKTVAIAEETPIIGPINMGLSMIGTDLNHDQLLYSTSYFVKIDTTGVELLAQLRLTLSTRNLTVNPLN